ncbi:hypothetical protein [Kitasatospora sp. NPDC004531]
MALRQALDLLGERPAATPTVTAEESTDRQDQDDESDAERSVN